MRILTIISFLMVLNGCFELPEEFEFEWLRSDDLLNAVVVPEGFNYSTTKELEILITTLNNCENPKHYDLPWFFNK